MLKEKGIKKINLNLINIFWIFFIGCYFGVLIETLWCIITNGYIESRTALIIEPLNPVYGLGALLITVISNTLKDKNIFLIFLTSMILGAILEFLCSFFQEMIFGSVSWIYNQDCLGILKRTSLLYSVYWGLLSIIYIKVVEPKIHDFLGIIDNKTSKTLTLIFFIIVTFDILYSSKAILRQNERLNNIQPKNKIDIFFDKYYNDDVLLKIYPHMYFTNKNESNI